MFRSGLANLPLHGGKAPPWLIAKMIELGKAVFSVIVLEYGEEEILRRLSDPFWFQCLACVLGYDWHSSGTTTVTLGVLKSFLNPAEHGLVVVGGKGIVSRRVPDEIDKISASLNLSEADVKRLKRISRLTAKVDNAAIQDGFQLYHHSMIISRKKWVVIQQGMDKINLYARRYHWFSDHSKNLIVEPHTGIVSDIIRDQVLDMCAKESDECRRTSLDLVKDNPRHLKKIFNSLKDPAQKSLTDSFNLTRRIPILDMPTRIDWDALNRAYELQPDCYEDLLLVQGVGPAAVRALALISQLIWGASPSWRDPAKFSFAHGGKDGVPYPVNRKIMEKTTQFLTSVVQEAKINRKDKMNMLKRLSDFIKPVVER
ncbi:MAG: DUF763 domain-containing protein [Candidatus Odinarchaeum yellowstonii]|uniref:DUF763 domain-containing protein n=1 Tax=Odinarchaeota yellowstonii (strain LCB_4) TaxID=1841599 RepID=A0AAF0D398_ODILC|nr:MAG: DUF763 domain-containing protein [Candidatus Odinarchaeum yellowstonii]